MNRIFTALILSSCVASASAALQVADFENLQLQPESCWTHSEDAETSFNSGSFGFPNLYNKDWGSWAYYGYANYTANVYPGGYSDEAQTINAVGGGHASANYAVAYCDAFNPEPTVTLAQAAVVPGMYVTNTAWVVDAILKGDGMSPAFDTGDYLKIIVTGKAADGSTKNAEFYLADFRSSNAEEHYYVSDWRYFDLSSLGEIASFTTRMETSKTNGFGATTPLYFALDDLGAEKDDSGVRETGLAPEASVSVADGVACVRCAGEFSVEAVSLEGFVTRAFGTDGEAYVALPSQGVNILRIATANGTTTLKVLNR